MKRTAPIILGLLLMASNLWAAPVRSYVGIQAGAALPAASSVTDAAGNSGDVSYKPGYTVSGVLGHEFGTGLRVEGEVNYAKADLDKIVTRVGAYKLNANLQSIGLFGNAYYDLLVSSRFAPYVVGGLGMKNINISSAIANGTRIWNSANDSALAYQMGFGTGIRLTRDVTFDMGYRYQGAGDVKIDQVTTNVSSHNILFGIRYYP